MTALLLSQYLSPVKEKVANVLFYSLLMDKNHYPSVFLSPVSPETLKYYSTEKFEEMGYRVNFNAAGWHRLTGFCHA